MIPPHPLAYSPYNEPTDEKCSICLDELESDVVAHDNEGSKHPVHKECIRRWLVKTQFCPTCKVDIDITSLGLPPPVPNKIRYIRGISAFAAIFEIMLMCPSVRPVFDWQRLLGMTAAGILCADVGFKTIGHYDTPLLTLRGLAYVPMALGTYATMAGAVGVGINVLNIVGDMGQALTGSWHLRPLTSAAILASIGTLAKRLLFG